MISSILLQRPGRRLTSNVMDPGRFDKRKEIVKEKYHIQSLVDDKIMPRLRFITSLVIHYEC
jgi:hypothetical protein